MGAELKRLIGQLLQQISVSEFRDENGHLLTKFKAYDDLVKYLNKDMGHPKDGKQWPIGTRLFWTRQNIEVEIVKHNFQYMGKTFLNYEVREINGRRGKFAAYHDDLKPIKE